MTILSMNSLACHCCRCHIFIGRLRYDRRV